MRFRWSGATLGIRIGLFRSSAGAATNDWAGFLSPSSRVNLAATLNSPTPPATPKKK